MVPAFIIVHYLFFISTPSGFQTLAWARPSSENQAELALALCAGVDWNASESARSLIFEMKFSMQV